MSEIDPLPISHIDYNFGLLVLIAPAWESPLDALASPAQHEYPLLHRHTSTNNNSTMGSPWQGSAVVVADPPIIISGDAAMSYSGVNR